jgi:2,3-bisphosphoglycerate-dependent phosphoglycerate mutase
MEVEQWLGYSHFVRYISVMAIEIVYETHSISEDNEQGIATGWLPGRLSDAGRAGAAALGRRRCDDGLAAIFVSDLARAIETVELAFAGSHLPVLMDWRLRECDYGQLNGAPASEVHRDRRRYLDLPYPDGESWRQAAERAGRFLSDLPLRWDGQRVLVVGHAATRYAFEHILNEKDLAEVIGVDSGWQEGWEYRLS